jgi:hypothetical protein
VSGAGDGARSAGVVSEAAGDRTKLATPGDGAGWLLAPLPAGFAVLFPGAGAAAGAGGGDGALSVPEDAGTLAELAPPAAGGVAPAAAPGAAPGPPSGPPVYVPGIIE